MIFVNYGFNVALGGITVDNLTSDSQKVLDSVLNGFYKMPPEAFWNSASISISICFCQARHLWRTLK